MILRNTQRSQETAATAKGCAIAAVIAVVLAGATAAGLHFAADAFLVVEGGKCEGCFTRGRECMGILVEADMRDGEEARCVGIPVGPWHCARLDHGRYVKATCPR